MNTKGLVLFSGGLDSLATLLLAIEDSDEVVALHYSYGQNSQDQEREQAESICAELNVPLVIQDLNPLQNFLISGYTTGSYMDWDKSAYVPNRNALFITLAHSFGLVHKFNKLYCGLSGIPLMDNFKGEVDKFDRVGVDLIKEEFANYSDMSDGTMEFMDDMKNLLERHSEKGSHSVELVYPLRGTKKEYCYEVIGRINPNLITSSTSCYNTTEKTILDGSIGCSDCDGCRLRDVGFMMYNYAKGIKIKED